MLKMKFWFEGNQLQPDCNIHGGCKIGSSACHACPHCVRVNSKDQEVLCLGDGSEYKEAKLEELRVGGVVVLASVFAEGKISILTMATKDAVAKGIHAGNIVKEVARICGGGGGGRPNMAQAGGKNPAGIPAAIAEASKVLEGQLA